MQQLQFLSVVVEVVVVLLMLLFPLKGLLVEERVEVVLAVLVALTETLEVKEILDQIMLQVVEEVLEPREQVPPLETKVVLVELV